MTLEQMMSIEQIKEEARRLEGYEAWSEALELYERGIAQLREAGASDPSLFSRAGDLHLRLQRPEAAAECYESAVDQFARDRNLDSAFAVCQKILRHLPDREQVYLKVARIRAAQGFPEYARQHYLTYAKMRGDQGDRAEAVSVLEELVGVVPADLETRVFLADRLAADGRRADALAHLHEAYLRGQASRDRKGLEKVRERIVSLDPGAASSGMFRPAPEDARTTDDIGETEAPGDRRGGPLSKLLSALRRRGSRDIDGPLPDASASGVRAPLPEWAREPEPVAMREPEPAQRELAVKQPEPATFAFEPAAFEFDPARELEPQPAVDAFGGMQVASRAEEQPEPSQQEAAPLRESAEEPDLMQAIEDAALRALDMWAETPVEKRSEPPAIEQRAEARVPERPARPFVQPASPVQPVHPTVEPVQPQPSPEPIDTTVEKRRRTRLEPEYVADDLGFGAPTSTRTDAEEEAEVLALLAAEPMVVAHHERFVRHASRIGDPALLIDGLLHMAMALRAAGLEWRAKSTLARILSMEPSNQLALEAFHAGGPAADPLIRDRTPSPPAPASPAEQPANSGIPETGFVDLAALIFDDPVDTSTRWQVAANQPTRDENADFALILSQFKDKVSSHLEHSDARAHYELGSAYREMGLLGEAIGMFQEALRADPNFLPAIEMLGRTFLDKGDFNAAIKALQRGLSLRVAVEDDLIGIYYYMGNGYEWIGNREAAKDYYMRVFAMDINFIDVTERLRTLR